MNRAVATSIFALPFALALVLHFTGILKRIDDAIDRKRLGILAPQPGPARPLESYAGWWDGGAVPRYGSEWVTRVIVRTEGKNAWIHMWHYCPPNYCEEGELKATVYGEVPADVYALEVLQKKGHVWRTVVLRPNGSNPNLLLIQEARRAKDPHANQSNTTGLKRVR